MVNKDFNYIYPYNQGVAIKVTKGKYGAVLLGGKELIEPRFDYLSTFVNGKSYYCLNNVSGLIDLSGNICVEYDNKIILFDSAKYDGVREFSEGYATYIVNNKCGVVDQNGNEITGAIFDEIHSFRDGIARVKIGNKWTLIDTNGNDVCENMYKYITNPKYGLYVAVPSESKNDDYPFGKNYNDNIVVIINRNGTEIIKFPDLYSVDISETHVKLFQIIKDSSIVDPILFYDHSGKQLIENQEAHFVPLSLSKYLISRGDEGYGVKNSNGTEILPPIYEDILKIVDEDASNEYAIVNVYLDYDVPNYIKYEIDTSVCVNFANQIILSTNVLDVLPQKYFLGKPYNNNLAIVEKQGKWGVINKDKVEVIPLEWDYIYDQKNNLFLAVKSCNRYVLDKSGNILFETEESNVEILSESLLFAGQDYGTLFDFDNNKILENVWKKFTYINELIIYRKRIDRNELCGVIDGNGKCIIDCAYNSVDYIDSFFLAVKKDCFGKTLSEDRYDDNGLLLPSLSTESLQKKSSEKKSLISEYRIIDF